jgi:hypothetical protein
MDKLSFVSETSSEFFVGNLNKTKTRDEIFQDLTKIKIECLNENLYISKFNMPKFNARKDQDGNLLLNLGYAFVTTRKPEMAQELIEKKRMKLDDGSDIEFKPINRNKRLVANQNCKDKNISKINDVNGTRKNNKNNNFGAIGDWRNQSAETTDMKSKGLFDDLHRAPASVQQNDENMSFGNSTFLWQPFEFKVHEEKSSDDGSNHSIFDICKNPHVNTEIINNGSFRRRSLYSQGSDR